MAGRSNSGKSTAINAMVQRRNLARTSKTPGRTQLINFFELGADKRLVDLPGYGYAKGSESVRRHWRQLLEAYFRERKSLVGLIITVDIRRGLNDLDLVMLDWAERVSVPVAVLLTRRISSVTVRVFGSEPRLPKLSPRPSPLSFSRGRRRRESRRRAGCWRRGWSTRLGPK